MRLQPLLLAIEEQEARRLKPELNVEVGAVWLKPYPDTKRECSKAKHSELGFYRA